MARLINSDFNPAWWLSSPHLQTVWPTLFRDRIQLPLRWQRVELLDGDFIDLAWHGSDGPLVLLIHGLEGSLASHYATPLISALGRAGYRCIFMHLRGCSGVPNRLQRSYHSGATEDLVEILQFLQRIEDPPQAVIGISLGGNLLLKYLGEVGRNSPLQAAAAVSVPFDLGSAVTRLQQGLSQIYNRYLLRKLLQSHLTKCRSLSMAAVAQFDSINTIYDFDDRITAIQNGFADAADYYQRCSCKQFLREITTPTLIVHARDDPFMHPKDIPRLQDLGPGVSLELSDRGGHVGFVQGNLPWRPVYWLDQRIPAFLNHVLA
jgi:predicted alpha/beta-fold hydrolase